MNHMLQMPVSSDQEKYLLLHPLGPSSSCGEIADLEPGTWEE